MAEFTCRNGGGTPHHTNRRVKLISSVAIFLLTSFGASRPAIGYSTLRPVDWIADQPRTGKESDMQKNAVSAPGKMSPPTTGWETLPDAELTLLLSGKTIVPDLGVDQKALEFSENFTPEGKWVGVRKMRQAEFIYGTWYIKNGKICVKIYGAPEKCRIVSVSIDREKFLVEDLYGGDFSSNPLVMIFKSEVK